MILYHLLKSKLFNKNHQNKNTMKYEKKYICLRVYFSFFFSNVKKIFSRSSLCIRTQRSEIADIHYLTWLIAFSTFIENLWKIIPFADKNRTNKMWRSIKWKTYCKSTYPIGGPYHLYLIYITSLKVLGGIISYSYLMGHIILDA